MTSPVIILHVVGRLDMGGAESRIMDIYRLIDRSRVQFYFAQHTTDHCVFEAEIEELGGRVFTLPRFKAVNLTAYQKAWRQLFRDHPEIRMVQGHMTSTASLYLPIAKRAGVETTIAHARSAGVDPGLKGLLTRFLRKSLWKKCDYCFTCSRLAAEAVFGKRAVAEGRVILIPNAIEVDKFAYDEGEREDVRRELNLQDCFVLGHVGRFSPVKNHEYLLRILEECIALEKKRGLPRMLLMLLGEGELQEKIRQDAIARGIASRVLFLGNRKDVHRYYQGMDFFLLPSFYEGLPGTAIEAQASGLVGILSDTVTGEAMVTDLMEQLPIGEPPVKWAERIVSYPKKEDRSRYADRVKAAGYDVAAQVSRLQRFYLTGSLRE